MKGTTGLLEHLLVKKGEIDLERFVHYNYVCCLAHPHLNELTHPKAWRGTKKHRYFL